MKLETQNALGLLIGSSDIADLYAWSDAFNGDVDAILTYAAPGRSPRLAAMQYHARLADNAWMLPAVARIDALLSEVAS